MRYCPDSTVFLRLQDVGCLEALATVSDCELVLTDIVWDEVTRKAILGPAARKILAATPSVKVHRFYPDSPETLQFARLRAGYPESTYHDGELSVVALAAGDPALVPVIVERRGLVAACDELRREVMTGHWFFSELRDKHGLPAAVFQKCVAILNSKGYPTPTWFES